MCRNDSFSLETKTDLKNLEAVILKNRNEYKSQNGELNDSTGSCLHLVNKKKE